MLIKIGAKTISTENFILWKALYRNLFWNKDIDSYVLIWLYKIEFDYPIYSYALFWLQSLPKIQLCKL